MISIVFRLAATLTLGWDSRAFDEVFWVDEGFCIGMRRVIYSLKVGESFIFKKTRGASDNNLVGYVNVFSLILCNEQKVRWYLNT